VYGSYSTVYINEWGDQQTKEQHMEKQLRKQDTQKSQNCCGPNYSNTRLQALPVWNLDSKPCYAHVLVSIMICRG